MAATVPRAPQGFRVVRSPIGWPLVAHLEGALAEDIRSVLHPYFTKWNHLTRMVVGFS